MKNKRRKRIEVTLRKWRTEIVKKNKGVLYKDRMIKEPTQTFINDGEGHWVGGGNSLERF